MSRRYHGYHFFGDIYAYAQAFGINGGEVSYQFVLVQVAAIEADMLVATEFHFGINGACYNIAGSQAQPFIVFLHELIALNGLQYASESAQRLSDQKRWPLFGIV